MSRTVCPACRQHHRTRTPHRDGLCVAAVTAWVAWVVLVAFMVAAVVA